jgi:hypothetical protein
MQVGAARLWVSYRQFWLHCDGAGTGPPDQLPPMSFVQLRPDAAMITTGLALGDIAVTVQQLDSAPNEFDSSEAWEDILEFSLGAHGRPPIRVVALEASAIPDLPDVSTGDSTGPFRVRIHALGRQSAALADGELPERYLIQSWQSAQSDPQVIRQTCAPTGIVLVDRPEAGGGRSWSGSERLRRAAPKSVPTTDTASRSWPTDRV